MAAGEEILVTCEHAVNRIPRRYADCFAAARADLDGHRGSDLGALWAARRLAGAFGAPLETAEVSRLLIDLNRSRHHRRLFSEYSVCMSDTDKDAVVARYYEPYRSRVEAWIRRRIAGGRRVLHLSVHSFVPVLHGVDRDAAIGLLYDPTRAREKRLCAQWVVAMRHLLPGFRIRRNYPYRGVADGFTTYLRSRFPDGSYCGVEVEINQTYLVDGRSDRGAVVGAVADGLIAVTSP